MSRDSSCQAAALARFRKPSTEKCLMISSRIFNRDTRKFVLLVFSSAIFAGCSSLSRSDEFARESIRIQPPLDGEVIRPYDGKKNKGLDFSVKEGSAVHAAASGEITYSGSGLHGYGVLIIIKHGVNFLTIYGNNKVSLVRQGEHVQAGQKIAILGNTQTGYVESHFELRKNGAPVDPAAYMASPKNGLRSLQR